MEYVYISLAIVIGLGIIGITFFIVFRNAKHTSFIKKYSIALKEVEVINKKYNFNKLEDAKFLNKYDDKNMFSDIFPRDYLVYKLDKDLAKYKEIIKKVRENQTLYDSYKKECEQKLKLGIYKKDERNLSHKKLVNFEIKLLSKEFFHPITNFVIKVALTRTDLYEENTFDRKIKEFNESDIEKAIKEISSKRGSYYLNRNVWDSICKVERGKATNKVRFEIYKRDGYRCKMCGVKR